jgi:hypothetical protein
MDDERLIAHIIQDSINTLQEILTGKRDPKTQMHAFATAEATAELLNQAKADIELALSKVKPTIPGQG